MIKDRSELQQRPIEIDLNGSQGNAFYLLGLASKLSKDLHKDGDKIVEEMKNSDYDNLIEVFDREFGDYVILYR